MNKVVNYKSPSPDLAVNRRHFLKSGALAGAGLVLGRPEAWAGDKTSERPATNIDEAMNVPRVPLSLPGTAPGRVVEVADDHIVKDSHIDKAILEQMFDKGMNGLTGVSLKEAFNKWFTARDVVGIKVNPVGPGIISTHLELVDVVIDWLVMQGLPKKNIIIWDRFDYMLTAAGFTTERFPGVGIQGLQTMDEEAYEGKHDDSRWLGPDGKHVSLANFDQDVYYWADIDGPEDKGYLNQHVVNTRKSYFGKLVSRKLTRIINIPVFKNTGNGISMATKNLGYGAVCNTGRLHRPLFFDVCTEVLAFPAIRDKLVLNITDGLRGQYDGGPMPAAEFTYDYNRLFFATDPFALDMVCHHLLVQKRKEMEVKVNEHPRFTRYLNYAQELGLGVTDPEKIEHIIV